MSDNSIWHRRHALNRARYEKLRELTRPYDTEVYNPAMDQLRKDCAALGHGPVTIESNGVGTSWTRCRDCSGRVEQWSDWQGDDAAKVE
jgi:hypothetical protein